MKHLRLRIIRKGTEIILRLLAEWDKKCATLCFQLGDSHNEAVAIFKPLVMRLPGTFHSHHSQLIVSLALFSFRMGLDEPGYCPQCRKGQGPSRRTQPRKESNVFLLFKLN